MVTLFSVSPCFTAFTTSCPVGHLPEDGVLAVQPVGDHVGDEELAPVGVRAGIGHGKGPDLVLVGVALDFVLEPVAGAAAAAAFRIAALDHEVGE